MQQTLAALTPGLTAIAEGNDRQRLRTSVQRAVGIDEVIAVFQKWLYLPDPRPLLAVLGVVAANQRPGDPVWMLLVGPPGDGKSELLGSVVGLPHTHPSATLTEAALLSGAPKRETAEGAKGGLLRAIGEFGILLCKDFGSVLSMNRDARAAVLAALREVYDGSWTRHVGTDGGRTLHWSGKVGLLAACTPTIDRHHAVMGAMGERFVLFRMPQLEGDEQARRSLEHAGRENEMRRELSDAVAGLFSVDLREPAVLTGDARERLVALTTLVVRCRSAVERDGYSREVELIPRSEAPPRLIKVLDRLLAGLQSIGVDDASAWAVIAQVALDSIPALRRYAMRALYEAGQELTISEVAEFVGYPRNTTERALEDLAAHKVASVSRHGSGKATTWELTSWARERYVAALATFPETSRPNIHHPITEEDVSGEVAATAGHGSSSSTSSSSEGVRE